MKVTLATILLFFTFSSFAENIFKPKSQKALDNYVSVSIKKGADATIQGQYIYPFSWKVVTAKKIIADYKANQLKANKIYKGKYTRIINVASSIEADISGYSYIVANGKSQFEPIVLFIDPNDERFLDIIAGDRIDLICKGMGIELEIPAFDNCMFTKDFVKKATPVLIANLKKASNSNYKPQSFEEIVMIQTYLYLQPVIQQSCEISTDECANILAKELTQELKGTPQTMSIFDYIKANPLRSILYQL